MKTWYIIIMLIMFLGYFIFFGKSEPSMGYGIDGKGIFRTFLVIIGYLISWIVWFILFK